MISLTIKRIAAPLLALTTLAVPVSAHAVTIVASGSGTVTSTAQGANATISATGAPVGFTAQFDPAKATLIETDPSGTLRAYDLQPSSLAAMIGGHSLNLDANAVESAVLIVSTAFGFFGGMSSEAVLIQEFQFSAGAAGETSPVRLNGLPPARELMSFTFTFRTGDTIVPATIESLRDPAQAARGSFFYRGDTGTFTAPAAQARGSATGVFDVVSPVPEPGTWALMLLGFTLVGTTLRRRRTAWQLAQ